MTNVFGSHSQQMENSYLLLLAGKWAVSWTANIGGE